MPRTQLHLDANSPSIIVPVTARDRSELSRQAEALARVRTGAAAEAGADGGLNEVEDGDAPAGDGRPFDLIEWRVDLYEPFTATAPPGSGSIPSRWWPPLAPSPPRCRIPRSWRRSAPRPRAAMRP